MNLFSMKKGIVGLVLVLISFLTLPVYAWPEVDHMNMCGSPTKPVLRGFSSWAQYDRYIAKRGKGYYLRTNCPNTVAPAKKKYVVKKKRIVKKIIKRNIRKVQRMVNYSKIKRVKSITRRAKYNEKLDCARVDRANGFPNLH